ncbi:MAG: hypothetical protein ACK4ND_05450 [Cytophagaceae bacterium]
MFKHKIYYLLFLIFSFQFSYGQNIEVYDSLVAVHGNIYQAYFNFYVEDGDTLYHGPFALTKQIEEDSDKHDFHFSAINGRFVNNKAEGHWAIRKGYFTPAAKGVFKDYSYAFKISGTEFIAKGDFKNGKKNSLWSIYEWKITNSSIKDTLFSAELPFKDDNIIGEFKLFHDGEYLEGFIDDDQFTEDKWSFYITDKDGNKVLIKEWIFLQNKLVKKILYDKGDVLTIEIRQPGGEEMVMEELTLNENYLNIIDLKAFINHREFYNKYKGQLKVRDLFFMMMKKFHEVDSRFVPITNNKLSPEIKVKIEKFPLQESEISLLNNVKINTYKADSILKAIKKDPQINLACISIEKVAFYTSILNAIYEQYLAPNKMIIEQYKNGNIAYVNRNKFVQNTINVNESFDFLQVFNKDTIRKTYTYSNLEIDSKDEPLQQFMSLSKDILTEINQLKDSLNIYVQEVKDEKRLIEMQAALYKKYEEVKKLNDSLITPQHDKIAEFNVKEVLDGFITKLIKDYSSLQTIGEKMNHIAPTLKCFNKVEDLLENMENAPENTYRVRDAYTRKVFNPYTLSYMEEKVKRPIYRAFTQVLLPGIFENLKNLDCNNIEGYSKNFTILFEEMINIRAQETRKEEKKLKRTKDAIKAAEVLNFDLKF